MEEADTAPAGADSAGEKGCGLEDAFGEEVDFRSGGGEEFAVFGQREEGVVCGEDFGDGGEGGEEGGEEGGGAGGGGGVEGCAGEGGVGGVRGGGYGGEGGKGVRGVGEEDW